MASERGHMTRNRIVLKCRHDLIGRYKSSYGHSATHAFGAEQDVGRYAEVLKCPELACSAETGLDFIQDQQRPRLVTLLPQRLKIMRIGHPNPRLALDGFHNDSGGIFSDFL